jgi:NADH-quinone oxidoreductase subunit B
MLIDALMKLHDQIGDTKLGANRAKQVVELEQTALVTPHTSQLKGLLR